MRKSKIFFILMLSFIGGVSAASFYYPKTIDSSLILSLFVLNLIILAVFWNSKKVIIFSFCGLFFLGGFFLVSQKLYKIINLSEEKIFFSGKVIVSKEPEIKEKIQKLIVSPVENDSEKFLLNVDIYEEYEYGEILKISCELERPKNFSEDFDYRMYLAKDKIFYECKKNKLEKTGENGGNKIYLNLLKIKKYLIRIFLILFPLPRLVF
jgi:hypothetical protein